VTDLPARPGNDDVRDLEELEAEETPALRAATRLLRETSRVEAFSDGVFAIAVTLLVFTLTVPTYERVATAPALRAALVHEWPTYLAFVMSFFSILVMWASHHNIFNLIRRVDHVFLLLNGLILMGVAVTPFTTEVLASHLGHPGGRVAAQVYCLVALFIAASYNALWYWARRGGHLLEPGVQRETLRAVTRQYAVAPVVYALAFGLSFLSAWASMGVFVFISVYYAIPTRATVPLGEEETPA
jgi:uncharacterized membrane protein